MNRFDRITAILIQLQSRKVVKAQDIAERFNISLRTVYRDIRSLEEAGVPLIGEAGVGYSIVDGYRLPPVMFMKEEAMAFLTAEKLVERFTDEATKANYQSAMFKVKAVLRSSEKDMLENMEENIAVRQCFVPINSSGNNTLEVLLKSIAEKKIVKIEYDAISSLETTERAIEPIGVYHEFNNWYTIAFCHLRNSYRNFRTDRIQKIQLTDEGFNKEHASLKEYLEQLSKEKENLEKVVIRIDKSIARYIESQKYYLGFVSETIDGEEIEQTFLCSSLEGFARWFIMFADQAKIIMPEVLKEKVKGIVAEISMKL